jgi:dTMP kinase
MGYFITIEGGEGSGKTSVLQEVIKLLNNDGYTNIVTSREPGGIKIATQIREVLLDKSNTSMDALTETFLFAASRRQHIVEKVLPELNNGAIFICDRFVDSSYVYQGIAGKVGLDRVVEINEIATMGCKPDLTILFDLDPRIGLERINKNKDREVNRLDLASIEYHDKVRAGYKQVAEMFKDRIVVVDASKSFEQVINDVYNIIKAKLEEQNYERVSK